MSVGAGRGAIPSVLRIAAVCLAATLPTPGLPSAGEDALYLEEIREYRQEREQRLSAPEGWLSLIGLFWLDRGENPFGSDPDLPIALPPDASPPRAGTLIYDGRSVRLVAAEGVSGVTVNGEPVRERTLADDSSGSPDTVRLGRLAMYAIRRGERVALRVKDPQADTRLQFAGLDYYPVDPELRVEATLEAYPQPRPVEIPTVAGTTETMQAPGRLVFQLAGRSRTLEPLVEKPGETELFIIFRDETSGTETYGAGRYLYATLRDGKATLDFNKAYNPPCAFTRFATCPLPPRGNRLDVPIRAGEKKYGDHRASARSF